MRFFSFYLPQFHEIPENNEWWGEGFTEWTNVKKAQPLFKGHKQPLHPLDNNFYDLMDEKTVVWQTDLLHRYRVDGFIYYHYYFEGKLLLEKPAENLLKNKLIDQPFFFCWANHPWKRSWEGKQTILIEQTYGGKESWEKHFQYLLPFFKDERYEKKDNKPLFMIFQPIFEEKNDMMNYFNERCKEEGFAGIAVIDTTQNIYNEGFKQYKEHHCDTTEYVLHREPGHGQSVLTHTHPIDVFVKKCRVYLWNHFKIGKYVVTYSGDKIMKEIIKYKSPFKNSLKGLFFEWDNTSRHEYRGYIIKPISKKMFERFMESIKDQDYLFINAWNEWCEGMILEPTVENSYKYLEWIKEWREKNDI